jgi:hypothetical protein
MVESARVRWQILATYAFAGAIIYSVYIRYLSSHPPDHEYLDPASYRAAWRWILFTGAAMGAITYLLPHSLRPRRNKCVKSA